jgi:hypothetical protein
LPELIDRVATKAATTTMEITTLMTVMETFVMVIL